MLKTRIWLNGRRGLLLTLAALVAAVGAHSGHLYHVDGFFDG